MNWLKQFKKRYSSKKENTVWWDFKRIIFLDVTRQYYNEFWSVVPTTRQTVWFIQTEMARIGQ